MQSIIFHIPHSSTVIPPDVRQNMSASDAVLAEELRILTDHHTHALFEKWADVHDILIVSPVSRLVVDVERFPEDANEPMSEKGMGAVYLRGHDGTVLRSPEDRERLIRTYYEPHHQALELAVERQLSETGRAVIVDCHSFPEAAMPCERDHSLYRPQICIGTDTYHTPEALAQALEVAYRHAGYTVARDTPFSGAIVPLRHYHKNPKVHSVMIELRRDIYMDERTSLLLADNNAVNAANAAAISAVRQLYQRSGW